MKRSIERNGIMEKRGFTFFFWRVLAHRLQHWAQVVSLQVNEEVYVIRRDLASMEYSASSVSSVYEMNEADALSGDDELPPAHWLERVNRGASPPSWFTRVNQNALGNIQQQAVAAPVPVVLSPESESAPSQPGFVKARVGKEQSHAERKILFADKDTRWPRDGGIDRAYRDGVDGSYSSPAPIIPLALSRSHANVFFSAQQSTSPLLASDGMTPSLLQETASFASRAQNNANAPVSSPEEEGASLVRQKNNSVVPSEAAENLSTLHQMVVRPPLSQRPVRYPSSPLFVAHRENEPGVSHARARIPDEEQGKEQRSLKPTSLSRWKERPSDLSTSFVVSTASSRRESSVSERIPGTVNPYRAGEQVPAENYWPSLPENFEIENEDWERVHSAWERQQRLDREQQGSSWNV